MKAKLVSKLQYHNYEEGEYSNTAERNFDESIKLIESFPWQKERLKTKVISLTNPSVTFEKNDESYLKLSTSFNQKFVLSYFTNLNTLYSKYLLTTDEAYCFIENYFTQGNLDVSAFRKQNDFMQNYKKHFKNKNFAFTVTLLKAFYFFIETSLIYLLLGAFMVFCSNQNDLNLLECICFTFFLLGMGGGINIFIFLNFWLYSKDKVLLFSKGNPEFYFGDKNNPILYNKKDILNYSSNYARKGPLSGFNFLRIEFNDHSILKIPNIFLHRIDWENKLYNCEKVDDYHFPFCN